MTNDFISASAILPPFRKREFLESFSEDDFREKVIRPLYHAMGLKGGRETCGINEEGKDCYMFREDAVTGRHLYAIQTKKGDITLAGTSKVSTNLANAMTQIRTALETTIKDSATHRVYLPTFVILVASGKINKAARDHIVETIKDPRIVFRDGEDLIPDIDNYIPQLWNGISVAKVPYLRSFREMLLSDSQTIDTSELNIGIAVPPPIVDDTFAQLYLHRYHPKLVKKPPKKSEKKSVYIGSATAEKIEVEEVRVQELLDHRERTVLVTGDAGAGKTTALRRLGMILADKALQDKDEHRIPVYLYARDISESNDSLLEFATQATRRLTTDHSAAFESQDLENGNVILLVDALDEIPDSEPRAKVLAQLKDYAVRFPKSRVIVTSRMFPSIAEHAKAAGFINFYISPISLTQAEAMIHRLTSAKSLSKEATQEMLRRLENVHGLELNPLLVTVFVSTSQYSRTDIPANITELFRKYTEMMLGRWNRTKTVGQQHEPSVKDMLLQRVAYAMHVEQLTAIPLSRVREIVESELSDRDLPFSFDTLYAELMENSGLVRVQEGELFFRHHLLQEFFAGRGIPSTELLAQYATDDWWTRALVFYFGQDADNHLALTSLRKGVDAILGANRYQAAVVVGLATQACYLMKKSEKVAALRWVVEQLSAARDSELQELTKHVGNGTLLPFIWYYLYARDAVAARNIGEVMDELSTPIRGQLIDPKDAEQSALQIFWCVAGLIESHQLERAEKIVKQFRPDDFRLLLALHLGAYCVKRLHVTSDEDRKIASQIAEYLDPAIDHLRTPLVKELKGLLVEVRDDKVAVLDHGESATADDGSED